MRKSSPTRNANGFAQCVVMTEGVLRRSGNWNGSGCSRFLQRRPALATFSRAGGRSSEDSTVPANVAICNLRPRSSSSKRVVATQERTMRGRRSDDEVKKRCRCTKHGMGAKQAVAAAQERMDRTADLAAAANAACRSNQQQQPQLTSQPSSSMHHRSGADSRALVALVHNRRLSTSRLLHCPAAPRLSNPSRRFITTHLPSTVLPPQTHRHRLPSHTMHLHARRAAGRFWNDMSWKREARWRWRMGVVGNGQSPSLRQQPCRQSISAAIVKLVRMHVLRKPVFWCRNGLVWAVQCRMHEVLYHDMMVISCCLMAHRTFMSEVTVGNLQLCLRFGQA